MTDYFPRRGQRWSSTFLCLRKSGRKKSHTHTGEIKTHSRLCTHTLTFQTEHGSPFIHKKQIVASFSCLPLHSFLSSPLSCSPLLSSLLPPLSTALCQSVHTQTHRSRHTHSSLPSPLAISLPLALPSHTHTL